MKIKIGILCFCLLLAGSLGFHFLHAQNDAGPMPAPLNPAFLKMIQAKQAGTLYQDPKLGYLPGPVDHSLFTVVVPPPDRPAEGYAASYDLRTYNKVTSVKDQGNCGSCWAFSSIGGIESSLMPTESRDFSEQHLNKYHGFDWSECGGGNTDISAAYFARWSGPYNETDCPYPYSANPEGFAAIQKHVQRVVWLPKDKDTIKAFVSSSLYGAVSFAFYVDESDSSGIEYNTTDAYYNATNYAYYYPSAHSSNHEILIIGWDDNFDKTKFSTTPSGNGAWLCKNSWGTSYENGGYFWMSYYDATINDIAVFSFVKPVTDYKNIYQYDPLGFVYSFGAGSSTTFWSANIFTATTNDPLKAISYVTTDYCSVTYYIYKNPTAANPTSGTLVASGTQTVYYPCYFISDLSSPVTLATGDKFSVVIKFVNNSYTYPAALEGYYSGYSSGATNAAGQSFYSADGSSWTDYVNFASNSDKMNCCIKAFTGTSVVTTKADFNADGHDDILWRYYGAGGMNVVWEMGAGSGTAPILGSQAKDNGAMNLSGGQGPERIYWSPLEAGDLLPKRPARSYRSAMEVGEKREIAAVYQAPWEVWGKGKGTKVLASPMEGTAVAQIAPSILANVEGTAVAQTAPSILASVVLYPVADTNWEIAGVGDFNGDGKPDILWRNYGTAGWTGTNVVWYMNGTTIAGQDLLYTVTDPNWRIVGVGDFSGDGKPDILWRNSGTGMDVVWYMNGAAIAGQDVLYTVANPNWKIVGAGDFNGDGKSDILWRDSGTGMNVVWYMNGAAITGQDVLYTVADANWRIEGVGDYNGDGKPDILWRNYGSGGWMGTNVVWYMNCAALTGQDLLYPVTDLSWRIVIH